MSAWFLDSELSTYLFGISHIFNKTKKVVRRKDIIL